jgi:hypothetical protein
MKTKNFLFKPNSSSQQTILIFPTLVPQYTFLTYLPNLYSSALIFSLPAMVTGCKLLPWITQPSLCIMPLPIDSLATTIFMPRYRKPGLFAISKADILPTGSFLSHSGALVVCPGTTLFDQELVLYGQGRQKSPWTSRAGGWKQAGRCSWSLGPTSLPLGAFIIIPHLSLSVCCSL